MTDAVAATAPERGRMDLTALDWIGAVVAGLGVLFLFQFPLMSAHFAKMFADFGGELPAVTRLGLTLWFPMILGAMPLVWLVAALGPWFRLGVRRALIVFAFVEGLASAAFCLYAMYAPIFALAAAIK